MGVFIGESYAVNRAGLGQGPQFFVARFRGLIDGGSDKVPAMAVPEPGTWAFLLAGLVTMIGIGVRRTRT